MLPFAERIYRSLSAQLASATSSGVLSEDEIPAVSKAIADVYSSSYVMLGPGAVLDALEQLWKNQIGFREYLDIQATKRREAYEAGVRFSLARLRWSFVLSDHFTKNIEKVDRKLQGRVLEDHRVTIDARRRYD